MAIKTKAKIKKEIKPEIITEKVVEVKKVAVCKCSKWMNVGWVILLLGGLAHMLPEQMAPILGWSVWGISLQMVIGVLSVVLALNFLLED